MVTSSKWLQTPFPRSQQVISYGLYPYFKKWSLTCLCNTAFFATRRVKNILRSIYYGIDISLFHQLTSFLSNSQVCQTSIYGFDCLDVSDSHGQCVFWLMNFLIPPQSIVSYARSVFLQSNKKIFDVTKLPLDEYAQ